MRGKSLAVIASAVNVKASDATMNGVAQRRTASRSSSTATASRCARTRSSTSVVRFRVNVFTQGGPQTMRFPQLLDVRDDFRFTGDEQLLDTGFAAFFRIPQVSVPVRLVARPAPGEAAGGATRRARSKLARASGPRAHHAEDPPRDGRHRRHEADAPVASEGRVQPVQPRRHGRGQAEDGLPRRATRWASRRRRVAANNARVLVISSSQFFANPFARAGNGPDMGQMGMMMPGGGGDEMLQQLAMPYAQQILTNTILVFKNMLDWVTGDVDLLAVSREDPPGAQPRLRRRLEAQLRRHDRGAAQEAGRDHEEGAQDARSTGSRERSSSDCRCSSHSSASSSGAVVSRRAKTFRSPDRI